MHKAYLLITLLVALSLPSLTAQDTYVSREEMRQDLDYLVAFIERAHPNAYHYTPKADIDALVADTKASLPDSLSRVDFWRVMHPVIVRYNDAHTRSYIKSFYREYVLEQEGRVLPLHMSVEGDVVTITDYRADVDNAVILGESVVSINHVPIAEVVATLKSHASAELDYLDEGQLSRNFGYYLWMAYGWGEDVTIEIALRNGSTRKVTLPGATQADLMAYREAHAIAEPEQAVLQYRQLSDSVAYLRILNFYDHNPKTFKKKFKQIFEQINAQAANRHLILDFRGHDGGDSRPAVELGRYLSERPVAAVKHNLWKVTPEFKERFAMMYIPKNLRWLKPLYRLSMHTRSIWRTPDGENAVVKHPTKKPYGRKRRFTGDTYLLIDNGTFSAGSIFAGMFNHYDMGTSIGQPTGNLASFYADPIMWGRMPNSRLVFQVSASYQVAPDGNTALEAVQPDLVVPVGVDLVQYALDRITATAELNAQAEQ